MVKALGNYNKEGFEMSRPIIWKKKNMRIAFFMLLWLPFLLISTGCAGTELENKYFPLAVLLEAGRQQYDVCYLSQNLSEIANERANGDNQTAEAASGATYYEAQKSFEKNNRCKLDLSHTKALIFQEDMMDNKEFVRFLDTVRKENTYARNTLVFLAGCSMKKLQKLNSDMDVPLGSYLEQMIENEQDQKEQSVITLGNLLNEQANQNRTLLIPVIKAENSQPVVSHYKLLQDFVSKGTASIEEAQIYFLLENGLKQMDLRLDYGAQVRLSGLKCKRKFQAEGGKVIQQLFITADAKLITGSVLKSAVESTLQEKMLQVFWNQMEENQADITDSYRRLAMEAPEIYRDYVGHVEEYRIALECSPSVTITIK